MPNINHQEWLSPEGILRTGERITDEMGRGTTGWLDWNDGYEARTGTHTARMMVPDQINDIEVEEEARGQGVGKELFQYVLGRTQSMGYQEVLVLGSHKNSKKFYQLMLEGLKQSNQIRGYDMFPMKDVGYESWNFRIKI